MKKNKVPQVPPPPQAAAPRFYQDWRFWGYGAGAALCLLGLVLLSVAFGQVLRTTTRGVSRLEAPGIAVLALKNPGLYVGFYQHKGKDPVPLQELAALEIAVRSEDGASLPVERGAGAQAFAAAGQRGAILFQFQALTAGRYEVTAASPLPEAAKREILVIHESLNSNRADIFAGIVLCLVLGGFGVYILLRTHRAAQRAAEASAAPPHKKK